MTSGRARISVTQFALLSCIALVAAFVVIGAAQNRSFLPIDTQQVLDGVGSLDRCAHEDVFSHCEVRDRPVGPFPVLQYAIALTAKRLGASYSTAAHLLIYINVAAALGVLALLVLVGRRLLTRRVMAALVLVGLTGPLPWYSRTGFAEDIAMFLALAAVVAFALRLPAPVTVIPVFLTGLTKETAPLFIVALLATIVVARRDKIKVLIPVAAAGLLAALVNGGFNVWRYGTFYNEYYAEPARLTPGIARKAEFFAGQLVAPNAGIFWWWPAATLLLVAGLVVGVLSRARSQRQAALLLTAIVVVLLGLFASYHSPFGWNAWGPRYLIPWMPALCVSAAVVAGDRLEALLARLTTRAFATAALAALVAVLAMPQAGVMLSPLVPFRLFDDTTPPCRYDAAGVLEAFEHPNYYACESHLTWTEHLILPEALKPLGSAPGAVLIAATLLAVGGLAAAARRAPPPSATRA